MITRVSSVIRPKGSDLLFEHSYNADYERRGRVAGPQRHAHGSSIRPRGARIGADGLPGSSAVPRYARQSVKANLVEAVVLVALKIEAAGPGPQSRCALAPRA